MARRGATFAFIFFIALCRIHTVHASSFSIVGQVGKDVTVDLEPSRSGGCALSANERWMYIIGTAKVSKKSFGEPLRKPLGGLSDIYISKVDLQEKKVDWTVADGTQTTDVAESVLLYDNDNFMFVAGSTYGNFQGGSSKGTSDIFYNKYKLHASKPPSIWWQRPITIGTSSVDSITSLAADGNVIYAIGYTDGNLFGTNRGALDAILFAFDATKGSILRKVQFGKTTSERAMAFVVGTGAIVVVVEEERKIKSVTVTNLHLYKFSKSFAPLGDVLLETFATESVASIIVHHNISGSVLVVGTSKLDDNARDDVLIRRVAIDTRNTDKIGSKVVQATEIKTPEYVSRIGGSRQAFDYGRHAAVHPSGRIVTAGFSTGQFGKGAGGSVMEPFMLSVDTSTGEKEFALQKGGSKTDWFDLRGAVVTLTHVHWVGQAMNWQIDSFYSYVGSFSFTEDWLTPVQVDQKKTMGTNTNMTDSLNEIKTVFGLAMNMVYIIAGVCGGVLLLIIILIIWCCCCKGRSQS